MAECHRIQHYYFRLLECSMKLIVLYVIFTSAGFISAFSRGFPGLQIGQDSKDAVKFLPIEGSAGNSFFFSRLKSKCKNKINLECTAIESKFVSEGNKKNRCKLFRRCDGEHKGGNTCPKGKCTFKKKLKMGTSQYTVRTCVAEGVGVPCKLKTEPDLRFMKHPTSDDCDEAQGQKGSVTYVDLTLPSESGRALFVEVTTDVPGQNTDRGFFVRPTRLTREWGKASVSAKTASFYLADTGQFSVEFASDATWKSYNKATNFDALMLFVNPPLTVPKELTLISPGTSGKFFDLGPNKNYLFLAGIDYDWGKDYVFKVHDNTSVYFEQGAHVRARIVQTEKKVKNVLIQGYGTLDVHYDLKPDVVGISDDATRQNVGIFGKNIRVTGLTLINTNPTCGLFGYCLNINANWSPLGNKDDPFDAWELQLKDPPYKFHKAHCQEKNMDDSPNSDFTNCPTSRADGQVVSFVKCMTWQLGHDGLNAGKWGTVQNSFVRTIDDAIKPWDSHGIYRNITIWQLTLGWPINFGWWNWNQPDIDTVVTSIYIIHNHNWATSSGWPETQSGQCVVGGIYGSGAIKSGYRLSNIFVETAASCAVGLQISKKAYSRHLTPEGCVGSMKDIRIDGMYFDEEFYQTGGYNNFLSGETKPNDGCIKDLSGKIENMIISGNVGGRALVQSDFVVNSKTVPGLTFETAKDDPHPPLFDYFKYADKNTYNGHGSNEIDVDGVKVFSMKQCILRCHSDWTCECVVFQPSNSICWKRSNCKPGAFEKDEKYEVLIRQWE
mmetsp:Transcript_24385/g.55677  ORF Transcript_24385/g.55677 Transcript_24385/m.55677 type:complete len:778 (-) Transcript_24385:57-2390(-)